MQNRSEEDCQDLVAGAIQKVREALQEVREMKELSPGLYSLEREPVFQEAFGHLLELLADLDMQWHLGRRSRPAEVYVAQPSQKI